MNAEFSRRMARVVNSQYFYEGGRERSEELFTLRQELMTAQDVHDLSPKSKIVVAKAEKNQEDEGNDAAFANFDPNQPRRPVGDPEGGEWVTVGGYIHPSTRVHMGGLHAKVTSDGTVTAGPLKGHSIRDVKKHFESLPSDKHRDDFRDALYNNATVPPTLASDPEQSKIVDPEQSKIVDPEQSGAGTVNPFEARKDAVKEAAAQATGKASQPDQTLPVSSESAAQQYSTLGTRAPAFKAWFGDWEGDPNNASKVVNPQTGEPQQTHAIKVFHGTQADFDAFEKSKAVSGMAGRGFYFAEDKDIADMYADPDLGGTLASERGPKKGKVIEAYLNIRKPFDFDADISASEATEMVSNLHKKLGDKAGVDKNRLQQEVIKGSSNGKVSAYKVWKLIGNACESNSDSNLDVNDIVAMSGYDGVTHIAIDNQGTVANIFGRPDNSGRQYEEKAYGRPSRVWLALNPAQIKSTANQGTFDPNNPKIGLAVDA